MLHNNSGDIELKNIDLPKLAVHTFIIKTLFMETMKSTSKPHPVLTQTKNNTTRWIGHLQTDPTDHFAGQTFNCPTSGQLDNIQVYSSAVQNPGQMELTLHVFDTEKKAWGPAMGSASIDVQKKDEEKWIRFQLPPVPLHKNETYGFQLRANAMVAIGEAAEGTEHPFEGQEWQADSKDRNGHYYNYFSLAFKIEMCA